MTRPTGTIAFHRFESRPAHRPRCTVIQASTESRSRLAATSRTCSSSKEPARTKDWTTASHPFGLDAP